MIPLIPNAHIETTMLTPKKSCRFGAVRALLLLVIAPALALLLVPSHAAATPAVKTTAVVQSPDPTGSSFAVEKDGVMTDWTMTFNDDGTWDLIAEDGDVIAYGNYTYDAMTDSIFYENHSTDGGGGHFGEYEWNADLQHWDRVFSSHPKAKPISLIPLSDGAAS